MTVEIPENKFGITFVSEDEVPDAPRKRKTDTELWATVKALLTDERAKGKWAKVNEYDSAQGAQSKASQINNNNTKDFKASEGWEARSEVTKKVNGEDKGASALYMRYNGE